MLIEHIIWYHHIFKFLIPNNFLSCKLGTKSSSILSEKNFPPPLPPNITHLHWLWFFFYSSPLPHLNMLISLLPLTMLLPMSVTQAIASDLLFSPWIIFLILYNKDTRSKLAGTEFSLIVWGRKFWKLKH